MRWCSKPTSSTGNAATSADSQARRERRTRLPAALRSLDIGLLCLRSRALPASASAALSVCSIMRPLVKSGIQRICRTQFCDASESRIAPVSPLFAAEPPATRFKKSKKPCADRTIPLADRLAPAGCWRLCSNPAEMQKLTS